MLITYCNKNIEILTTVLLRENKIITFMDCIYFYTYLKTLTHRNTWEKRRS